MGLLNIGVEEVKGLDEVKRACHGNFCRCGTYPRIEEAIATWRG